MPVQWVNRPDLDFRGFSGTVVGGTVQVGDRVRVVPSGVMSTVARIVTLDGDLSTAVTGQSVTVTLADEVDCSRGDVLCAAEDPAGTADQFSAHIVWMGEQELRPGRAYLVKIGARTVGAAISGPEYLIDVNSLEQQPAPTMQMNEIGVCDVRFDAPIAFDPYAENREMGGFVVIDRLTNDTVAAGMLRGPLRRSHNVHWQAVQVDKAAREQLFGHRPVVVWFTGLSGAGKSTIANAVEQRLHSRGVHTYLLDGDNVRHGLNADLGFDDAARHENIRRVAEVSRLMVDAGIVVLVSFISPFRTERAMARAIVEEDEFVEVHVDTPLAVVEARDTKGLYAKARKGLIRNFTGIDSPYEPPEHPELRLDTEVLSPDEAADAIVEHLASAGVLDRRAGS
jgi:bifunctional enzyme CysN/CysC